MYVHVVDGLGFGCVPGLPLSRSTLSNPGHLGPPFFSSAHEFVAAKGPYTLAQARKLIPASVALIGCCGYTPETAAAVVAAGDADLIAFGRPFLGNPDLVEKIAAGTPLADPPAYPLWFYPHMFGPDAAVGYTKL